MHRKATIPFSLAVRASYTLVMLQARTEVRVRKGMLRDAASLTAVFRESWLLAYRGIIPQLHLESMIRRRDKAWWQNAARGADGLLVLEVSGKVAGYATYGRARGRGKHQGEIYEIYLTPSYQGLGLGEHLFEGARHALDERRLNGLVIWALAENEIAADFYWRRGGRPIGKTTEKIGGVTLEKIGYGWS